MESAIHNLCVYFYSLRLKKASRIALLSTANFEQVITIIHFANFKQVIIMSHFANFEQVISHLLILNKS